MHSCKLLHTQCWTCRVNIRVYIILVYCDLSQGNFEKPDEEEIEQTMKDTAAALNLVVSNKLQAAQPKTVPKQPGAPTFIKYTPSQQGPQYASGARERTIKMQDMPVDPMEPPKFRHKKVKAPFAGFDVMFGMPSTWLCSFTDCICVTMPCCEMLNVRCPQSSCLYHVAKTLLVAKA